MFKNQAFSCLNKYIGDYLYGFNPDQLKVGFLNGSVKLKNLTFRPEKVNQNLIYIHSPLLLKAGIIGNMTLELNYFDLAKTEIIIDDLLLVIGPNFHELKADVEYLANDERFIYLSKKITEFERYKGDILKQKNYNPESYINQVLNNQKLQNHKNNPEFSKDFDETHKKLETDILKHILSSEYLKFKKISINNIHLRYEDDQFTYKQPLSIGVLIKNIIFSPAPFTNSITPTSEQAKKYLYYDKEYKFVDNLFNDTIKKQETKSFSVQLTINNLEIYVNVASEMYIPFSLYSATINSEHGIFEAMPSSELKGLMMQYLDASANNVKETLVKIDRFEVQIMIAAQSLSTSLKFKNFLLVNFNLNKMCFSIQPKIIGNLLDFLEYFNNFTTWRYMENLRPSVKPMTNMTILKTSQNTIKLNKIIIREWFQMILWQNRVKKILKARRFDLMHKMEIEYKKRSLLIAIENFMPGQKIIKSKQNEYNEYFLGSNHSSSISQNQIENDLLVRSNMIMITTLSLKNSSIYLQSNKANPFIEISSEEIHFTNLRNFDLNAAKTIILYFQNFKILKSIKKETSTQSINKNCDNSTKFSNGLQTQTQESKLSNIFNTLFGKNETIISQNPPKKIATTNNLPVQNHIPKAVRNNAESKLKNTIISNKSGNNTPLQANRALPEEVMTVRHLNISNQRLEVGKSISPIKTEQSVLESSNYPIGASKIKGSSSVKKSSFQGPNQQNQHFEQYNKPNVSIFGITSNRQQTFSYGDLKESQKISFNDYQRNTPMKENRLDNFNQYPEFNDIIKPSQKINNNSGLKKPLFRENSTQDFDFHNISRIDLDDISLNEVTQIVSNSGNIIDNIGKNNENGLYFELKDSLQTKLIIQTLKNDGKSYNIQVEIGDIKISLDDQIIEDMHDYLNEFKKIHSFRYSTIKSYVPTNQINNLYECNKLSEFYLQNVHQNHNKSEKTKKILIANNAFNPQIKTNNKKEKLINEPNSILKRLTEVTSQNEIVFIYNIGNIHFSMSDYSSKNDIMRLFIPKGQIKADLKSMNTNLMNKICFYGIILETSNKFQAIYFLYKKIYEAINTRYDEYIEMNRMFYECLTNQNKHLYKSTKFIYQYSKSNANLNNVKI